MGIGKKINGNQRNRYLQKNKNKNSIKPQLRVPEVIRRKPF